MRRRLDECGNFVEKKRSSGQRRVVRLVWHVFSVWRDGKPGTLATHRVNQLTPIYRCVTSLREMPYLGGGVSLTKRAGSRRTHFFPKLGKQCQLGRSMQIKRPQQRY